MSRAVFARIVLLCCLAPGLWAKSAEPGAELPDILARIEGLEVSRETGLKVLKDRYGENIPPGEFRTVLKKALMETFCTQLLRRELRDAGFEPSSAMVAGSIAEAESYLPPLWPRTPESEKQRLVNDRDVQLKVAVRLYLRKTMPEKFKISDREIEDYYRSRQRDFLIPPRIESDELAVKPTEEGRKSLLAAEARLRQGESVGSVRASLRDPLERRLSPEFRLRLASSLVEGRWSEPVELPYGIFLIRINKRVPASYMPLSDVAPFIHQEIENNRAALELEKILTDKLAKLKIEVYF